MRLPPWLRKRMGPSGAVHGLKKGLRQKGLHTVCEQARCPNMGECFARGTATIMIMGELCTRRCRFCAVSGGDPAPLDPDEPGRVACQVREMGLKHAVITSVTRDDQADGGAGHFAKTVLSVRRLCPGTTIEVLTPDFGGRTGPIETVCGTQPTVFNHNIETVERLTPSIRDSRASYRRTLDVLKAARDLLGGKGKVKSGLMVGLGETDEEVDGALFDLARAGCDIATVGQYLAPSKDAAPVRRYVEPKTFQKYETMGLKHGIKYLFSGPFVRSSYLADKALL